MKKCSICKKEKEKSEFCKTLNIKSGLQSYCKRCHSSRRRAYIRTKKGLTAKIYEHQKSRSIDRGHSFPTYTKRELHDWLIEEPEFHVLYDNWKRSGYQKDYIPSVDRKDDSIGYTMTNIQLMTWEENNNKAYADMRSGKITVTSNPQKATLQFTKENEFIAEYVSGEEAARQTKGNQSCISKCCNGEQNTSGGFRWAFKEKGNICQ